MAHLPGQIRNEELYANAKMLNHEEWAKYLPPRCTPCDIDVYLDIAHHDRILTMEVSTKGNNRETISTGQRIASETQVRVGKGQIVSVVAKYPHVNRILNSLSDMESFTIYCYHKPPQGPFPGQDFPSRVILALQAGHLTVE